MRRGSLPGENGWIGEWPCGDGGARAGYGVVGGRLKEEVDERGTRHINMFTAQQREGPSCFFFTLLYPNQL